MVKDEMINTADKLLKTAKTIRKIAARIYRADLKARERALARR